MIFVQCATKKSGQVLQGIYLTEKEDDKYEEVGRFQKVLEYHWGELFGDAKTTEQRRTLKESAVIQHIVTAIPLVHIAMWRWNSCVLLYLIFFIQQQHSLTKFESCEQTLNLTNSLIQRRRLFGLSPRWIQLAAIHIEMTEKTRRQQNVVVSGMKEVEGVDDVDTFNVLCVTCLPVKPSVIRERCH